MVHSSDSGISAKLVVILYCSCCSLNCCVSFGNVSMHTVSPYMLASFGKMSVFIFVEQMLCCPEKRKEKRKTLHQLF